MQRYDHYLKQKLTEGELDADFDAVESALAYAASAAGVYGLCNNGAVTQKSGTPNISVDVTGPLVAYDEDGQRIAVGSLTNVPVSTDESSVSTTVTVPGDERYLSLFVKYQRALSDPRLDGAGDTVFYNRAESFSFVVVQGAQAPAGTAAKPALRASHILLADIKLIFGQTSVLNADITTTRTQLMVTLTGTPKSVQARNYLTTLQDLEDQINDIINGVVTIAASSVTYGTSGFWADGSSKLSSTNVEAALDEVVSDLAAAAGASRIGFNPTGTIAATSVQAAIAELDSELTDAVGIGACGATKVGFAPQGTIAASTVEGALAELSSEKAQLNGTVNFGAVTTTSVSDFRHFSALAGVPNWDAGLGDYAWRMEASLVYTTAKVGRGVINFSIDECLNHGDVLTTVEMYVTTISNPGAGNRMRFQIWKTDNNTRTATALDGGATYEASATVGDQTIHAVMGISETINKQTYTYAVRLEAATTGTGDLTSGGAVVVTRTTLT